MFIQLLKLTLILIYLKEAAGVDCLPLVDIASQDALRPMAVRISDDTDILSISQKASSAGDSTKGHSCPTRSLDVISKEFQIRNRMWMTSDEAGKKRRLQRLKYVIEKTKDMPDFLIKRFKDKKIISVIVLGTYLWFERASDIELLIITKGKDKLEIVDKDFIPMKKIKELLKDKKVSLTAIECIGATIGYDSLKKLDSLQAYSYAVRGYREGITIFGIDPYKPKELSSWAEKIQHLDFLLDSSEISLEELEDAIAKSLYDERAARVVPLYKDRIGERTTEAISMLKEIASRYGKREMIKSLTRKNRIFWMVYPGRRGLIF